VKDPTEDTQLAFYAALLADDTWPPTNTTAAGQPRSFLCHRLRPAAQRRGGSLRRRGQDLDAGLAHPAALLEPRPGRDAAAAASHEILAITFTKKAAGEMRQRLNEWLVEFSAAEPEKLRRELMSARRCGQRRAGRAEA
jgi:hypothetical protein